MMQSYQRRGDSAPIKGANVNLGQVTNANTRGLQSGLGAVDGLDNFRKIKNKNSIMDLLKNSNSMNYGKNIGELSALAADTTAGGATAATQGLGQFQKKANQDLGALKNQATTLAALNKSTTSKTQTAALLKALSSAQNIPGQKTRRSFTGKNADQDYVDYVKAQRVKQANSKNKYNNLSAAAGNGTPAIDVISQLNDNFSRQNQYIDAKGGVPLEMIKRVAPTTAPVPGKEKVITEQIKEKVEKKNQPVKTEQPIKKFIERKELGEYGPVKEVPGNPYPEFIPASGARNPDWIRYNQKNRIKGLTKEADAGRKKASDELIAKGVSADDVRKVTNPTVLEQVNYSLENPVMGIPDKKLTTPEAEKTGPQKIYDFFFNTEAMQQSREKVDNQLSVIDGITGTQNADQQVPAGEEATPIQKVAKGVQAKNARVNGKDYSAFSYNNTGLDKDGNPLSENEKIAVDKNLSFRTKDEALQAVANLELQGNFPKAQQIRQAIDQMEKSPSRQTVRAQNYVGDNAPQKLKGETAKSYLDKVIPENQRAAFDQTLNSRSKAIYDNIFNGNVARTKTGQYVLPLGDKKAMGEDPMYLKADSPAELAKMYTQLILKLSGEDSEVIKFLDKQDEATQNVLVDQVNPDILPKDLRPGFGVSAMRNDSVENMTFLNNRED